MTIEKALLGAGCFWGVDKILRSIPGIVSTEVGYAGGTTKNPTYEEVCTGRTDHAEVVLVGFDPAVISYEGVLDVFFRLHDPTTLNRQHNDIGTQYRSVIFTYNDEQRAVALEKIKQVDASKVFRSPVVTQVMTAPDYYSAEAYHQDYLIKNPSGYMCHILRD
ncbi:peptide-methionine (S)-S-oxide reductase MsrA [Bacteriovorax sp. PP10]|uniref:Peptide methionine sulfoxide reductase MsrA n=1 Tax=Bacteriovorax antarcticus TaxID=3088717 RepID=A0ABU5VY43_9BACT|nr:peptide-methionine (S)-S-oxide reductase MsrA [Bacteriovorax sp. PP10]MEA9357527.1 peptide-methionine (S)-S-oxide reductase MsrA [Bacteriovorax sp. PP10]